MSQIYSETDDLDFISENDESLLAASLQAGIRHTHVCGGHARCSTCRVLVTGGLEYCQPRNELEMLMSQRLSLPDNIRLACQTCIDGDVRIRRLAVDDVNLASRIEQANKLFGSQLLISQAAYEQVKGEVEVSSPYNSELKGKSGLYDLYEIAV